MKKFPYKKNMRKAEKKKRSDAAKPQGTKPASKMTAKEREMRGVPAKKLISAWRRRMQ